jgi:hypothetical protein
MKNHNVYEVSGDIEKKIKNGDFRVIIKFPTINSLIDKLNFENKKEITDNTEYPFKETLIKFYSPFRIGQHLLSVINLPEDILIKNGKDIHFDTFKFEHAIQLICKKYKNTIIALPICGNLTQFKETITKVLEDNIRDTKVVITEK